MAEERISPILSVLANAFYPPFVLALCIGLPSAVLYSLQLGLIFRFRKSHFKSSFFKLFAVRAIANLAGLIGAFLCQRFGLLGLFLPLYLQLPRLCLASLYFLVIHSSYVECIATPVLLLNRLTALAIPFTYEKFWKHAIPWAIALIFILPLPFTWRILKFDQFVHVQPDNSSFTIDKHPNPAEDVDEIWGGVVVSVAFTVASTLINLACLFVYRRAKKKAQKQQLGGEGNDSQEHWKMEAKLTIYAVLTFLAQLLCALYMILLYLAISYSVKWGFSPSMVETTFFALYNQLPWVNDLCTIALPAWLLLWASTPVRRQFASIFNKFMPCTRPSQSNSNGPTVAWSIKE